MNHTKINLHHAKIYSALQDLRYALLDASDNEDPDSCHWSERSMLRDYMLEASEVECPVGAILYKACAEALK